MSNSWQSDGASTQLMGKVYCLVCQGSVMSATGGCDDDPSNDFQMMNKHLEAVMEDRRKQGRKEKK